jgi:hypothetical protein
MLLVAGATGARATELVIALDELEGEYEGVFGRNSRGMEIDALPARIAHVRQATLELDGEAGRDDEGLESRFELSLGRWDADQSSWQWTPVASLEPGAGSFRAEVPLEPDARATEATIGSLLEQPRLRLNLRLGTVRTPVTQEEREAGVLHAKLTPSGRIHRAVLRLVGDPPKAQAPPGGQPEPEGRRVDFSDSIVFECYYINFAWGHQHSGYYVDRDGGVHAYDRSGDPWLPESVTRGDSLIPEADMVAKFEGARAYRHVPRETVLEKARLLPTAARGRLKRTHEAFDAGAAGCAGYLYDVDKALYQTIELGQEGDFRVTNSARAARDLTKWLRSLAPPRAD